MRWCILDISLSFDRICVFCALCVCVCVGAVVGVCVCNYD